jgi:hypothetical protein
VAKSFPKRLAQMDGLIGDRIGAGCHAVPIEGTSMSDDYLTAHVEPKKTVMNRNFSHRPATGLRFPKRRVRLWSIFWCFNEPAYAG